MLLHFCSASYANLYLPSIKDSALGWCYSSLVTDAEAVIIGLAWVGY